MLSPFSRKFDILILVYLILHSFSTVLAQLVRGSLRLFGRTIMTRKKVLVMLGAVVLAVGIALVLGLPMPKGHRWKSK